MGCYLPAGYLSIIVCINYKAVRATFRDLPVLPPAGKDQPLLRFKQHPCHLLPKSYNHSCETLQNFISSFKWSFGGGQAVSFPKGEVGVRLAEGLLANQFLDEVEVRLAVDGEVEVEVC